MEVPMEQWLTRKIVVSKFELQSRYYVHFGTHTSENNVNTFTPSYRLNSIPTVVLQEWLWY